MKRISLNTMNNRLKERFPYDSLEFIKYEAVRKPCEILCKECGTIYHHKDADSFFRQRTKKYYCHKCHDTPEWEKQKNNFLLWLQDHKEFELIDDLSKIHDSQSHIKCKCTKCGRIQNNKRIYDYYKDKKCFCTSKSVLKPKEILECELINNGYELLEEYINTDTPIKVRRISCGHEFFGRISKIRKDKYYCPYCHIYKGEEAIKNFLELYDIPYIYQYKILTYKKCYIDFYLPDYNLFIEFNGKQHYEPINYFGGEKAFKEQTKRDEYVKKYCKQYKIKLLEISYIDYENIPIILRGCFGYEE